MPECRARRRSSDEPNHDSAIDVPKSEELKSEEFGGLKAADQVPVLSIPIPPSPPGSAAKSVSRSTSRPSPIAEAASPLGQATTTADTAAGYGADAEDDAGAGADADAGDAAGTGAGAGTGASSAAGASGAVAETWGGSSSSTSPQPLVEAEQRRAGGGGPSSHFSFAEALAAAATQQADEEQHRGATSLLFAEQLAAATQQAPQRLAERLLEQLQQSCLEEASMGQTGSIWDTPMPAGSREFMQQVARAFVARAEALGFEQVEWWNGKHWRQSAGRYHILHDTVYDKYHMRIRVSWLARLPQEAVVEPRQPRRTHQRSFSLGQDQSPNLLDQMQLWLELQRQILEQQLQSKQQQQAPASEAAAGPGQAAESLHQDWQPAAAQPGMLTVPSLLRKHEERPLSTDHIIEEALPLGIPIKEEL